MEWFKTAQAAPLTLAAYKTSWDHKCPSQLSLQKKQRPISCLPLCFYPRNLHWWSSFLVVPKYFWAAADNLPSSSREAGQVLPAALPGLPCFIPWTVRWSLPGACITWGSSIHRMYKPCCRWRLIAYNCPESCVWGQALGLTLFYSAPGRLASISGVYSQGLSPWWWQSLRYLPSCLSRACLSPAHLSSE